MTTTEILLRRLLRVSAIVTGLAIVPMWMPRSWMEATHEAIGLGRLPDEPIVDYMARTLSALYAVYGGLLAVLSADVRRYRAVIVYLSLVSIGFGLWVAVLDSSLEFPISWALTEGSIVVVLGSVMLALALRIPPPPSPTATRPPQPPDPPGRT